MSVMSECACSPQCPARCVPERQCDVLDCPCFQLGMVEMDELIRQTGHLSAEEIHRMAVDAWSGFTGNGG